MIPPDGACAWCWKPSVEYAGFCSAGCLHDWQEGRTPPWHGRAAVLQMRCEKAEARVAPLEAALRTIAETFVDCRGCMAHVDIARAALKGGAS